MDDDATPWWEPPWAGTEQEHVNGSLDRLRATFRWKVDGLDAAGLAQRIPSSPLTLGGLLKHLAAQEDYCFQVKLLGRPMPEVWDDNGWDDDDDWEFTSAASHEPAGLYALYDAAVARSQEALGSLPDHGGLDADAHIRAGGTERVNARRLMFDLLEEYGRHTGHADILREAVDGRTGEDPDPDWRP